MENHKRILAIVLIVTASFEVMLLLFLNAFFSTLFAFILADADPDEARIFELVVTLLKYLLPFILLFSSLPSLIAGFGLFYKQSWALILALITGCFKLFSFPVGTCIGVYTIWIYSEEQKILKAAQKPG